MMEEHLSPGVIAKLLRGTEREVPPPEVKRFQFVVVLADDSNPEDVPRMIGALLDMLVQHHATASTVASSLFVGVLGVPFPEGNSAGARRELVAALIRDHGERMRIVHGECDGLFGTLGGGRRSTR